jgi:hypothetical protein
MDRIGSDQLDRLKSTKIIYIQYDKNQNKHKSINHIKIHNISQ